MYFYKITNMLSFDQRVTVKPMQCEHLSFVNENE